MSGFDYSALLHRRPFIGCAILINSTCLTILSKLGHHLINIGLSRLASVPQLQLSFCECLPTDYHSDAANEQLKDTLGELCGLTVSHDVLVIAGDWNTDIQ